MKKLLFVFGTRPEAIKMAPVVKVFESCPDRFATCVCVTAQHREMLDQVTELFKIKSDYDLNIMTKKQTLPDLVGNILQGVSKVIEKEDPDMVFIQGDTTTAFSAAQAAFYHKKAIAHIEAGLRTDSKYSPFPEEINRRLTGVMADFHLAPTQGAKDNLIKEGIKKTSIFVTGNTVIDSLMQVVTAQKEIEKKNALSIYFKKEWNLDIGADAGRDLKEKLILVTGHRRESFGDGFKRICRALYTIAQNYPGTTIVYPVHLNPNVQEPVHKILGGVDNIRLIAPLDYEPFVFLMSRSDIILTDSGGIQEEAPALGIPVLVMRETSERPEGIEAGSARLVGTDTDKIISETKKLINNREEYQRMSQVINPYGDGKASKRILKIISEYFGELNEKC